MKCPNEFCPSPDPIEEIGRDWWVDHYCQTCGYEARVHFTAPKKKIRSVMDTPMPKVSIPSSGPSKKSKRDR